MDERNVVVTCDDITEGRETFLYTLDGYSGRERIAEMLQFLVGRSVGDEETVAVTYT